MARPGDLTFASLEANNNYYNNTSDSLLKASINNAIAFGKNSKDPNVRAKAMEMSRKIEGLHQSEYYNQALFGELYQALGTDDKARQQLELASEVSGVTNEEFGDALNSPHIKLKENSIDDMFEPKVSSLNGQLYYENKQTGELLTSKEYHSVDANDKSLIKAGGFENETRNFSNNDTSIMDRLHQQASDLGVSATPVGN